MAIYDVTVPMRTGMPVYPGEPGPQVEYFKRIGRDSSANVSKVSMGSHCGTHIDAPVHFAEGRQTVDKIPLERLIGAIQRANQDIRRPADRIRLFQLPLDRIV